MVFEFNPKRHGDIELVVKEARARFDDLIGVMRVGEAAKSDIYQVICDVVPKKIANGARSIVVVCDPGYVEDFLAALEAGIHSGDRPNYWLRVWR